MAFAMMLMLAGSRPAAAATVTINRQDNRALVVAAPEMDSWIAYRIRPIRGPLQLQDKLAAVGYRALVPDLYPGKVAHEANEAEHPMTSLSFAARI